MYASKVYVMHTSICACKRNTSCHWLLPLLHIATAVVIGVGVGAIFKRASVHVTGDV